MEELFITWGYDEYPTETFVCPDLQDVPPWQWKDKISIQKHEDLTLEDRQCRWLHLDLENAKRLHKELGEAIKGLEDSIAEQARWKLEGLCDQCGAPPPLVNHPEFDRVDCNPEKEPGSINLCEKCHSEWMGTLTQWERARRAKEAV